MKLPPAHRSQFASRKLQMVLLLINFLISLTQAQEECRNYAPPAVIKGNKIFVSTTGEYLPVKGINYYPRPNEGDLVLGNSQDFYTEAFRSSWERDIGKFQSLGINAIRLYAVDPGQNHDAFMCALKAAGIYVIVGLAADCQNCAVQWQDPPLCYPQNLRDRGEFIIQQFAKYENVLGFSAGNEIALSAASYLGNLPCQKRFLRDMRAFIRACTDSGDMRHIPVGIIFADHEREVKAKYYNCRTDPEDELENAEFVGINAYLHCDGGATDINELIGYKTLLAGVASWGMTIPVMWTEFGCLNPSFETQGDYKAQRNFLQVEALFSPEYREHFNGGFVFEYSTEKVYSEQSSPFPFTNYGAGNYGVGYFSPENCDGLDVPCEYIPFPQFQSLADRYNAVDVSNEVTLGTYNPPAHDPPTCPDQIPDLAAFDWPTEFDVASTRTLQCPVLVPVYCAGVPGECVNVPQLFEDEILVPAPTTSDPATTAPTSTVLGSTEPPAGISTVAPGPSNTESSAAPSLRPSTSPTAIPTTALRTEAPTAAPSTATPTTVAPTPKAPSLEPTQISATEEPTTGASQNTSLSPSIIPTAEPSKNPSPRVEDENLSTSDAGPGLGREKLIVAAILAVGLTLF